MSSKETSDSKYNLNNLLKLGTRGAAANTSIKDSIDVVNSFPWTQSPQSSRRDTPFIRMTEQRIVLNSTVANLIYSATAAIDTVAAVGTTAFGGLANQFKPTEGAQNTGNTEDIEEEEEAKQKKRGIWIGDFEEPYLFRKKNK